MVEDLDSRGDEAPAALANLFVRAAGTNLVVVSHVNVEDKLSALGLEGASGEGLAVPGLV